MRLIITDTGNIWNPVNPYLEQFKEIVLVVYLNGEAQTDQYSSFVSPYDSNGDSTERCGLENLRLLALASVAVQLNRKLRYHDDIVFLTDTEPSTLYPYYVLKDMNEFNRLHLLAISPLDTTSAQKQTAFRHLLSDLTPLSSLLYFQSDSLRAELGDRMSFPAAYAYLEQYFGQNLIRILNGIYDSHYEHTFFDFASMSYLPLKEGFDELDLHNASKQDDTIRFPVYRSLSMLGMVIPPMYPEDTDRTRQIIERPAARLDGKQICRLLRQQRILLAEANHIPFESEECPSVGPCAGTCDKCDRESEYLRKQILKIPELQRVYPEFELLS